MKEDIIWYNDINWFDIILWLDSCPSAASPFFTNSSPCRHLGICKLLLEPQEWGQGVHLNRGFSKQEHILPAGFALWAGGSDARIFWKTESHWDTFEEHWRTFCHVDHVESCRVSMWSLSTSHTPPSPPNRSLRCAVGLLKVLNKSKWS
jgi:hypothetical protein